MSSASYPEEGFTLVEVLVALALLALMAVYALSAYQSIGRMQSVLKSQEAQAEVDAVARHFQNAFADIRPILENTAGTPRLVFSGKPENISFVTAADGSREPGGLYLAHYYVDDRGALVTERKLLRLPDTAPPSRTILLRGVKGISFKYSGPDTSAELDEWSDEKSLPRVVAVTIFFEDGDPRRWPSFSERLRNAD